MNRFNLRVYGILINDQKQVLVSDEYIRGNYYTKFPGGGLEFGEGTRNCLKREFMEELELLVETGNHIYTTDFFQMSAFNKAHQSNGQGRSHQRLNTCPAQVGPRQGGSPALTAPTVRIAAVRSRPHIQTIAVATPTTTNGPV